MPVAQRRIIRDRNAKPCAVVRRAVQRVNVAWSSALTTSFAFGRPVINTPIHLSMPEPHATSNLRDRTVVDRSVVDERIAASDMIGDPARGHCHALVVVDVQLDGVYVRMTQSCHRRLPVLGITRAQHHPVTSLRKL